MSRAMYTLSIKKMVESGFDFGMRDYIVIDEEYRKELNKKIIDYYYLHEIAHETPAQFFHYLNTWLNINMGGYTEKIRLARSLLLNSFADIIEVEKSKREKDFKQVEKGSDNENLKSEMSSTNDLTRDNLRSLNTNLDEKSLNKYSDTPSDEVDFNVFYFLTNASEDTRNEKEQTNESNKDSEKEKTTETKTDNKNGSYNKNVDDNESENAEIQKLMRGGKVVKEMREYHSFINNIEMEIINELRKFFIIGLV